MLTYENKKAILNDIIKEAEGELVENPENEYLILKINILKDIDNNIS